MSASSTTHYAYMYHALRLAQRNLGQTWPNPAVGAVIIKDGHIIGRGYTTPGGRPHAEPQAIAQAGEAARGATLYVTLEPCSHHGKTPPCAEAIIAAGIARVVVACGDPNPQVNGGGISRLRQAGIEVIEGICEAEARALNAGFFSVIERGRPFVSLKIATSLDGRIAFPTATPGQIQWLTGPAARAYGHRLRAEHDAILTGIGTVLADDPLLTCRLPGLEHRSPVRVVLDRQGRMPAESKLLRSKETVPLCIERETDNLEDVLKRLAERGITRLLVEGGQQITQAFLQANLVDQLYWFRAPLVIGEGTTAVNIPLHQHWQRQDYLILGQDSLEICQRGDIGV